MSNQGLYAQAKSGGWDDLGWLWTAGFVVLLAFHAVLGIGTSLLKVGPKLAGSGSVGLTFIISNGLAWVVLGGIAAFLAKWRRGWPGFARLIKAWTKNMLLLSILPIFSAAGLVLELGSQMAKAEKQASSATPEDSGAVGFEDSTSALRWAESPELGFRVQRPAGWNWVGRGKKDEDGGMPLVTVSKYPEPHSGPNPAMVFRVVSLEEDSGSPVAVLEATKEELLKTDGSRLIEDIHEIEIGGLPGFGIVVEWKRRGAPGVSWTARSRVYVVDRGDERFIIGAAGTAEGEEACEAEFEAVLSSLEFDPKAGG